MTGSCTRALGRSCRALVDERHPNTGRKPSSTNELGPLRTVWPAGGAVQPVNHDMGHFMTDGFQNDLRAGGQEKRREPHQALPWERAPQRAIEAGAPLNRQALIEVTEAPEGKPGSDVVLELVETSVAVTVHHHRETITTMVLTLAYCNH